MSKTVVTAKGSVLPLMKLKGKDYLLVAHRLQWLSDEYPNYTIKTEFLRLTDEEAIAQSTLTIYDTDGKVVRQTMATKRETKKDFPDFIEKAETGSQGRALAAIGLGTQMALADLDEGHRIVDSPVIDPKEDIKKPDPRKTEAEKVAEAAPGTPEVSSKKDEGSPGKPSSSFRKPKTKVEVTPEVESEWS